jgi:hypothetical protein
MWCVVAVCPIAPILLAGFFIQREPVVKLHLLAPAEWRVILWSIRAVWELVVGLARIKMSTFAATEQQEARTISFEYDQLQTWCGPPPRPAAVEFTARVVLVPSAYERP